MAKADGDAAISCADVTVRLTVRFVLFIVSTRPASWTMDAKPVKFWPWMAAQRLV